MPHPLNGATAMTGAGRDHATRAVPGVIEQRDGLYGTGHDDARGGLPVPAGSRQDRALMPGERAE